MRSPKLPWRRPRIVIFVLFGPLLLQACEDLVTPPGEFLVEAVDVQRATDASASLALDASGSPRVAYSLNGDLKYATRTEVQWVKEAVGSQCETPMLALDASGTPHLAYYDRRGHDLGYAVRSERGWTVALVDTTGDVGWDPSLALDSDGRPHVAYYDRSNGDLKYAHLTAGSAWTVGIADSLGRVGSYASLALGADNRPHIAYWDSENEDLKYATTDIEGSWQATVVDAAGNVGRYASLALGPAGDPRIGYWDFTRVDLKYAVGQDGTWSIELVDRGFVWGYVDVAVDQQGATHIVYNVGTSGDGQGILNPTLHHAIKQGTGWSTKRVEQLPDLGRTPSLAIAPDGRVHLCYSDGAGYLRYAHVER